jgi:hypothetical protein
MEGENPTRRYKWFRPRQAARGYASPAAPANKQTILLNNSSGAEKYLIVRAFFVRQANNDDIGVGYVNGTLSGTAAQQGNLFPGDGSLPGAVYTLDDATTRSYDFQITPSQNTFWWQHDFPFAVLQPGQSLLLQDTTAAHAMAVAFFWEAVFPAELDWLY